MSFVIGLDIGTTSTIGILIELPSRKVALASRPVTLHHPHPGWAEEDPQQWWDNVCALVPQLLRDSGVAATQVRAVGVAGMLPAVVLLDHQHRLLRPSIQQSDGRCADQVQQMRAQLDPEAFVQRTGNGINQQLVACKMRWLQQHEPQVVERVACVFGSYDYIAWRLTGQRHVEHNWALEAGFIDLATGQLSEELIGLAGLDASQVPPLARSHDVIGSVSAQAAAATGLPAGIPVIAGVADHVGSAYAAGVNEPGDMLIKLGGAGDVLMATAQARPDARMFLDNHVVPGLFMPNGCMACSGSLLNWFAQHFGGAADRPGQRSRHASLDLLAERVEPGSEGVLALPYFLGEKTPVHDPLARGTFTGLSLSHGLGHVWRALLESVAFGMRHHAEVFTEMGMPPTRLLASDGGSGSTVWLQIMADVLQRPITRLNGHPGSCLGAAWVAAMGAGLATDWAGVSAFVSQADPVQPRAQFAATYDECYARYRALYQALKPLFAAAAAPSH
jgi:xylulokinase